MGTGFVLFFLAILGSIAAVGGALVLVPFVGYLTRKAYGPEQFTSRMLLLWATAAFPFVCLAWGGVVFVGQAVVNVVFLNRDVGIGDGFDVPLPNGYELSFIDSTERGFLYGLRGRRLYEDNFLNAPGTISDVKELQMTDQYFLGSTGPSDHFPNVLHEIPSYFLLDWKTGRRTDFDSKAPLDNAARAVGVRLALEPVDTVYWRYRWSWFDLFVVFVLIVPPLVAGTLLMLWVRHLRRSNSVVVAAG